MEIKPPTIFLKRETRNGSNGGELLNGFLPFSVGELLP